MAVSLNSNVETALHELMHYANDRISLMKEVLKILKPKKIKAMAPDCLKSLDLEELNSMLLEELLGISKKRLKRIFEGQNNDDQSSSASEDIDIISLDDITDDEDIGVVHTSMTKEDNKNKIIASNVKQENVTSEKTRKSKNRCKGLKDSSKLLSVLELLELQARARAIKSQLLIEAETKRKDQIVEGIIESSDEDDVAVIETNNEEEIIIQSDSEPEIVKKTDDRKTVAEIGLQSNTGDIELSPRKKIKKINIIKNRLITPAQGKQDLIITINNKQKQKKIENNSSMEIKEELVNVSDKISSGIGPVEIIHLDTIDVDLNEIRLPTKSDAENILHRGEADMTKINKPAQREKSDSDNDDVLHLDTVVECMD